MVTVEASKWYHYRRSPGLTLAGPWLLAWIVSTALLELPLALAETPRTVIALLPLPAFGWSLWRYIRYIRAMDELRHRIELEALAIAFPLSVALLMAVAQLTTARPGASGVPITNWSWIYLVLFYWFGRLIAARRYS